ncbi:unnamed protein product [Rangifer tarandus platyrhynchus]|uniref:Uncharacterized protein n=2 Tax=Rangifer tarandus platyrhynchus TaxID=3082113 RepID=A0ABN9A0B7_RANTA|nr:unnamed protein product [Rangifer tarandus platyrhynchus]
MSLGSQMTLWGRGASPTLGFTYSLLCQEHRKLYSSTLLGRRVGSLQYGILLGLRQLMLDVLLLIRLLLLLGCEPTLLFCPGFQVIVALVGHAEEQGGVTAELDEQRDLHRRNHLVRDSRRTDAFELWYWRKLLRVPWTA